MYTRTYEHFCSHGHNDGFLEDVTITLTNKTDGKDPKNTENYGMRTLKTLAPSGLNIEDCPTKYYICHRLWYIKVSQLFGRQYIRTWTESGLHVIMFMFILHLLMYLLFYIVYVTSYSFTAVFGIMQQASGMECFCENS